MSTVVRPIRTTGPNPASTFLAPLICVDPNLPSTVTNTAAVASLRHDYTEEQQAAWLQRHEENIALARAGTAAIAFFGDSLIEKWCTCGHASWARHFEPLHAANFGISGDRTQQLLWRMLHGELDGMAPNVVVLLIGTNNLNSGLGAWNPTPRNSVSDVVGGIAAIVQLVCLRLPNTRILLHGLLPRGGRDDPARRQTAAVNEGLCRLDDGGVRVSFIDLGTHFFSPDGTLGPGFMPDLLHLNEMGYEQWAVALQSPLALLLNRRRP